ncbi:hypothetical protein SV7mr_03380 [Stieleria bergensis]|uniref:Uncharacterized protein n=1 Tax=Stieleria bergensis TaxID=2528025 RepID=A0A517SP04_9BACT|nr:hypothetical protein SV7mr_03380 [Planctomycetes bacterium SV_7m_r]
MDMKKRQSATCGLAFEVQWSVMLVARDYSSPAPGSVSFSAASISAS